MQRNELGVRLDRDGSLQETRLGSQWAKGLEASTVVVKGCTTNWVLWHVFEVCRIVGTAGENVETRQPNGLEWTVHHENAPLLTRANAGLASAKRNNNDNHQIILASER